MKDFWHGRRLLDAAAMATGVLRATRFGSGPSQGAMGNCSLSFPGETVQAIKRIGSEEMTDEQINVKGMTASLDVLRVVSVTADELEEALACDKERDKDRSDDFFYVGFFWWQGKVWALPSKLAVTSLAPRAVKPTARTKPV